LVHGLVGTSSEEAENLIVNYKFKAQESTGVVAEGSDIDLPSERTCLISVSYCYPRKTRKGDFAAYCLTAEPRSRSVSNQADK
jgi:hypothetical protein